MFIRSRFKHPGRAGRGYAAATGLRKRPRTRRRWLSRLGRRGEPFDKIIVTCSPEKVPQPLVDQLREGGRLLVPVGERFQQTLYLFKKVDGKLQSQVLEPTMFVPMTGEAERARAVLPDGTKPALLGGSFERSITGESNSRRMVLLALRQGAPRCQGSRWRECDHVYKQHSRP